MVKFLIGLAICSAASGIIEAADRPPITDACKMECPKAQRPHEVHLCLSRLKEKPETKATISESCRVKFEAYQEFKTSGHFGKKK